MREIEHRSTEDHRPVVTALAGVEAWERFSFYGMQAILVYYLYQDLDMPEQQATALVGAYGACLYLFTYAGGWVGDRLLGAERTLLTGCGLLVSGHLMLAILPGYAGLGAGLLAVAMGSGLLKTAAITLLGLAFPAHQGAHSGRRDAAFQFFYLGINVGALCGPLTTGWLAQRYGYHAGFAAAAVLMVIGVIFYLTLRSRVRAVLRHEDINRPAQPIAISRAIGVIGTIGASIAAVLGFMGNGMLHPDTVVSGLLVLTVAAALGLFAQVLTSGQVSAQERKRVQGFIPLFVCSTAYWALFAQTAGVFAVYSDQRLDRTVGEYTIPAAWTQSLNPLYILVFSVPVALLMARFSPPRRVAMGLGLALAGGGMFILMPWVGGGANSTPLVAFASCVLCMSLGELCIGPVGMSSTGAYAPEAFRTRFAALYFLTMAIGTSLAGTASALYDPGNPAAERLYLAALGLVPLVLGLGVALTTRANRAYGVSAPPVTPNVSPVMYEASSDARNT